ncbi:MAG: hypothetical protein MZV64_26675 [Ignavibacteriales bacterium]|nr:hypothetical protein [Ignavibacteriales bacterium]
MNLKMLMINHVHNKGIAIDWLKKAVADEKGDPLKIQGRDITDISGITAETPVIATAARFVDQKGIDILKQSVINLVKEYKGKTDKEFPLIYIQGQDPSKNQDFMQMLIKMKKDAYEIDPVNAKRIVVADAFVPKYYKTTQLMADFWPMPSWFEPCGLTHKEGMAKNGMISLVNKVGGLTSGVTDKVDSIFVDFTPRPRNATPEKIAEIVETNGENLSKKMLEALDIYQDKTKFEKMITALSKR